MRRPGEGAESEWGAELIFLTFLSATQRPDCFFSGPPPAPQRESTVLIPHGLAFLGCLGKAVSAALCNASIKCHHYCSDWVNGRAVFPGEAGTDRPAFVSAGSGLNVKLHPRQRAWEQRGALSFGRYSFSLCPPALLQRQEPQAHWAWPALV